MKQDVSALARGLADVIAALDRGEKVTLFHRAQVNGTIVPVEQHPEGSASIVRHPAVGMWRHRRDLRGVDAHVRSLIRRGRLSDASDADA